MNNSIIKKIDSQFKKINSNDLSSTSSDFFYDYNKKKYIKQNGGSCSCNDLFKSASNENFELILYILKQHTCCFKCQDKNGDGYIGGVPGSKVFWAKIWNGEVEKISEKWVPFYNIHKTCCFKQSFFIAIN